MQPALKRVTPSGYRALDAASVIDYLAALPLAKKLGGKSAAWQAHEVGDGNLNLVFIVTGPDGALVVKQALPYVRLVGESWPLPLSRAHYEHLALREQTRHAPHYVPAIYHHDEELALTAMEYLSPHIILRKGLIKGVTYPRMAQHLGEFLALTFFRTSDLHLNAAAKKEAIGQFLGNTALCKITEDLVFDEPYFEAKMNRHTSPQLDDIALAFCKDAPLKAAAQEMKWRFQNHAEAMIHGDLHTGSVMATESDTRVIDPEFAFYGPMGFDIGAIIGNLLMAYFAQPGHAEKPGARDAYAAWILQQIPALWDIFVKNFTALTQARTTQNPGGDIAHPRLSTDAPTLTKQSIDARLAAIWQDSVGFAACKMIRRILGLAHVEDFESITDADLRAACERRTLILARDMLINRVTYGSPKGMIKAAQETKVP